MELGAKPKATTYNRTPPEPEFDFWRITQDLLYPNQTYTALTKDERIRVCRVARMLANIPYVNPAPTLDAECLALITLHSTGSGDPLPEDAHGDMDDGGDYPHRGS